MNNRRGVLWEKTAAYFSLLLGLSPAFLAYGRFWQPEKPLLWLVFPLTAWIWGLFSCLLGGKRRLMPTLLGLLPVGGLIYELAPGWLALPEGALCALLMLLMPPAFSRPAWDEYPPGAWLTGAALHLTGMLLAARPAFSGIGGMLAGAFAAYALMALLTMNRLSLRDGMHGGAQAPAALTRRNRALTLGVFGLALALSCLSPLARLLEAAWAGIKRGLGAAILWLMRLFSREESLAPGGETGGGEEMPLLAGAEEASPLMQWLEKALMIVGCVLLAAAAIFVLWFLGKKLRALGKYLLERLRRYAASAGEDYVDEAESILPLEERARALGARLRRALPKPRPRPWQALTGNERVRRLYARRIAGRAVSSAQTAREAIQADGGLSARQVEDFSALYDQARYSAQPVSAAQADALRQELEKDAKK